MVSTIDSLTAEDLAMFDVFGIPPELLERALVGRVTNAEARALGFTHPDKEADLGGILFPNLHPLTLDQRTVCVRRDRPDYERGRKQRKYLFLPGENGLWFVPGSGPALSDSTIPVLLVEAIKSSLALWALAQGHGRKLLPVAMNGCYGFRTTLGMQVGQGNSREKIKGPSPDLDLFSWKDRRTILCLDSNRATNPTVQDAETWLARELGSRGARIETIGLPEVFTINGPDDLIRELGTETMLKLLDASKPYMFRDAMRTTQDLDTTEDGLALELIDAHLGDLRYTAPWHTWHRWDGTRWRKDVTVKTFDLARAVCRDAALGDPRLEKTLKAGHTIASVVSLAATDQRIVMVPENWDQDKWLLNTPGGLVDLRTGELRTHDPTALITKITEVGPAGECPIWRKQLDLVTAGDRTLQEYLQRWAGYSLTGLILEEALAFFYGSGRNGKDTFVTTFQLILGDYARLAPIKTFTVSKNDQHPTDLAGLRSARLVVGSETSGGSRWDEERIKLLTGGGKVSARFMRGDFFDYMPEYKLWIMGNHKPSLRRVDVAMRRRLQLVPFTVQITRVDINFKASLRPEWPGILQWAIQGCLDWQRRGLDPPPAVIEATQEYFADQDTLGRWLSERGDLENNAQTRSSDAYADWKRWTETVKEYTGAQRVFSQGLMEKGFKQKKDGLGKMVFIGFKLKTD